MHDPTLPPTADDITTARAFITDPGLAATQPEFLRRVAWDVLIAARWHRRHPAPRPDDRPGTRDGAHGCGNHPGDAA